MGLKLPAVLLLTATMLAGCAQSPEASSQPGQSGPPLEQSAAVSTPSEGEPTEITLVDDPDSPYPMVMENWSVDMDGDGVEELIELRAEKVYDPTGPQSKHWAEYTQSPAHFCTLVVTKGNEVWEQPIGRESNEQPITTGGWFFPLGEYRSEAVWTRDGAGNPILVLWTDSMGSGGMGGIYVYAYAFQNGIVSLPVPRYGMEATLDQEAMTAQVTVPETGYTEVLDLNQWLADYQRDSDEHGFDFTFEPIYEDGTLTWPTQPRNIDGVYYAEPAEQGLVLRQFISGSSHADGMGDLVTAITWENSQAVVLDQYFDWNPKFWELFESSFE